MATRTYRSKEARAEARAVPPADERRRAYLAGIISATMGGIRPPLHPMLRDDFDTGVFAVSAGYVRQKEPAQ